MSLVVNTNVSSIIVQRSLTNSTGAIQESLNKLSTGFKINKAADDAAGLTISEGLKSQARGAKTAANNAQSGINLLQTAEGDLAIIQDNLQRIRDLTVQAANGTNGSAERKAIQAEVNERVTEINRLANSSQFNNINLLNGTNTTIALQIGPNAGSLNVITIGSGAGKSPLSSATVAQLGITTALGTAFGTAAKANSFISEIDDAISKVSERRSTIGSLQNRLESAIQSLNVQFENMSASESRIRDVDVADEAAHLTKNQILQQSAAQLLAQANQAPSIALSLI